MTRFTVGAGRRLAWCAPCTLALATAARAAPVELVDDVPDAADHRLVYRLDIPVTGAFNVDGVPYTIDAAAAVAAAGTFSRVAWHLQLEDAQGGRSWVYVSARAFTNDPAALGVPAAATGVTWQRGATELRVEGNVPGLPLGEGLEGFLEFWPTNYQTGNAAGVPGASPLTYDFGDAPIPDGGYGSMQVHALGPDTGHVLFAFNRWGLGGAPFDLGIGDCALAGPQGVMPDWTFLGNAGRYTTRRLDVYVVPGPAPGELMMTLEAPMPRAVYQRAAGDTAEVPIRGHLRQPADRIEARVLTAGVERVPFVPVFVAPGTTDFAGHLQVPAGWHRIEVRALDARGVIGEAAVEPVGVGEVFITAGQSNAANHGEVPLVPVDPRVTARGFGGWQPAADPQPVASGTGGSPWSALGDLLAARFDVPIGLLSVAVGGTTVAQWQPGAADALYLRLTWALGVVGQGGARAVLWHQGESDARGGTSAEVYAARMNTLITQSRLDAGWDVPWIVARVGFLPGTPAAAIDAVVGAQQAVIDADPLVFEGPATDDLLGPEWRYDAVHFNEAGLREHARRWSVRIALPACAGFADPLAPAVVCPDAGVPDAGSPDIADVVATPADMVATPADARAPGSSDGAADMAATLADARGPGSSDGAADMAATAADARAPGSSDMAADMAATAADARGPAAADMAATSADGASAEAPRPVADCACRTGRGATPAPVFAALGILLAVGAGGRRRRGRRARAHRVPA